MSQLVSYVHVFDEDGRTHIFGPGDEVPAWAAEKIQNPAAWDEMPEPAAEPEVAKKAPRTRAKAEA